MLRLFKVIIFFLVFCFISCGDNSDVFTGEPVNPDDNQTVINPDFPLSDQENTGNWVLNPDVSDEFEGSSIDKNKWQIQGENGVYKSNFIGRAPSQFSTENAIVEDGKLKILTKWEPDFNFHPTRTQTANGIVYKYENITTAAVISKKQFQYGYMEVKVKSANAQITSSLWTTGPQTSELDMFEMFGGHKTNASWRQRLKFNIISWDPQNPYYMPSFNGPVHTRNIQAGHNTAADFNVYGFEWTSDYIKIFINGELHPQGTITKAALTNNGTNPEKWVTDTPYWIWFDSETFPWLGIPKESELQTPAEYQIEYIRVWQ